MSVGSSTADLAFASPTVDRGAVTDMCGATEKTPTAGGTARATRRDVGRRLFNVALAAVGRTNRLPPAGPHPKGVWNQHRSRVLRAVRGLAPDVWHALQIWKQPTQVGVCHSYEVHTDRFKRSRVFLKVESTPFDHGAMRQCYRAKLLVPSSQDTQDASPLLNPLADIPGCTPQMARLIAKKLNCDETVGGLMSNLAARPVHTMRQCILIWQRFHPTITPQDVRRLLHDALTSARAYIHTWSTARSVVLKQYMDGSVDRATQFDDLKMQMVDIISAELIEIVGRDATVLYSCEAFLQGEYVKHNSNSGFVEDEHGRLTPQAFSHFTFVASAGRLVVVDIQGVGDLYTDPQIHTLHPGCFGPGNFGVEGFAMFFNTHRCSALCAALGLSPFSHPQRRSPVLSPPLLTKQSTVVTQTPIPVDASAVAGGGAVTSAPWSTLGLREALAHSVSPGAIPVAVRGRVSLPKLSVLVARVTMLRSLRNLRPMQSGGRGRLESDDTARHALGAGPAEAARTALVVAGDGAGHGQRGFQNRHLHECDHTDAGVLAVGAGVGAGRGARNHPGASVDRRRKGCSDGAASTPTAHGSGTTTTTASAMTHTPSLLPCCCIDMVRVVHSRTRRRCLQRALAQVHWTTARLCGGGTFTRAGVTRADACMFHLIQAADYGYTEAIATLAAIFGKVATDVIARRFVRRQASLRKRACLVFVAADKLRVRWCVEMLAYHRQQGLTTTRGEVVITKDTEQAAKLYLLAISLPPTSSPPCQANDVLLAKVQDLLLALGRVDLAESISRLLSHSALVPGAQK